MEAVRCTTKEEARTKAADELNDLFLKIRDPILFLSSGGSSLELLDGIHVDERITVSVLDERYSRDPAINNFTQLLERAHPVAYIDTRAREYETLWQFAQRFEKELRAWKERNPSGSIVITQGMGPDGHTSGMMPYPEDPDVFEQLFNDPACWVRGYNAKGKNEYPLRATTTMLFLRRVDHSIAYITGEKKRPALERILAEAGTLAETPARIMREMKNVKIFTDII